MISYKPLEITLIEKDMKKSDFYTQAGISRSTFQQMMSGKGFHVSTKTIEKACKLLEVPVEKIIEYLPD